MTSNLPLASKRARQIVRAILGRYDDQDLAEQLIVLRNTKVTRGCAHAVTQRLRDAVNLLEKGKLLTFSLPSVCQQIGSEDD